MATVLRNKRAGELIRDLRSDRGMSPEDLSRAIFNADGHVVSGRTIRRIEGVGMVPRVRIQFALASYFDRPVSSIWSAASNRRVEIEEVAA